MAAEDYLSELIDSYQNEPIEKLHKRLAGWRGSADHTVLTFAVLMELRALRAEITRVTSADEAAPCRG